MSTKTRLICPPRPPVYYPEANGQRLPHEPALVTHCQKGGTTECMLGLGQHQGSARTASGHRQDSRCARTPLGHREDTARTAPGRRQDTVRTPPGHRQDTARTPPGHRQDTARTTLALGAVFCKAQAKSGNWDFARARPAPGKTYCGPHPGAAIYDFRPRPRSAHIRPRARAHTRRRRPRRTSHMLAMGVSSTSATTARTIPPTTPKAASCTCARDNTRCPQCSALFFAALPSTLSLTFLPPSARAAHIFSLGSS
jgi:hypothetical protein